MKTPVKRAILLLSLTACTDEAPPSPAPVEVYSCATGRLVCARPTPPCHGPATVTLATSCETRPVCDEGELVCELMPCGFATPRMEFCND